MSQEALNRLVSKCQKCDREIFFGVNPATGKKIPLVAKPVTAFIVDETMMVDGLPLAKPTRVYLSHFGDCPAAGFFRRPKPAATKASTDGTGQTKH